MSGHKQAEKEVVLRAALKAKEGDEEAFKELFQYMIPAIIHAREHMKNGNRITLSDSMVIGQEAILIALEKFDPEKGDNFWSYGYRWIRNHLKKEIIETLTPYHIPSREYHVRSKVIKYVAEQRHITGETPSIKDIAKALNETEKSVQRAFNSPFSNKVVRPDMYIKNDEGGTSWDNNAELGMCDSAAEKIGKDENFSYIADIIKSVAKERTYEMICMYYGLFDHDRHTFEQIGNHFGISRAAAESHIKRTLVKVRKSIRRDPEFSKIFWL